MNARSLALAVVAAVLLGGSVAGAGNENDTLIQRLRQIYPLGEQYSVDTTSRVKAGAARIFVKAPIATTTAIVLDYANYKNVLRRFERSDVVGKHGEQTDVAVRVSILNGRSNVSGILRFDPPRQEGNETVIAGKMIEGNVSRFEATFRLVKVDAENTLLKLEMLIEPRLPFPGSLVTRESADASENAVRRMRGVSEKRFNAARGK